MGQQGIPSSVAPATADVIAQQSQVGALPTDRCNYLNCRVTLLLKRTVEQNYIYLWFMVFWKEQMADRLFFPPIKPCKVFSNQNFNDAIEGR